MTVKKISDSDKHEILNLYRQTGETTSTLATRYDVSNSTISRLLKSTLSEEEYEALIASKRAARTSHTEATQMPLLSPPDIAVANQLVLEPITPAGDAASIRLQPSSTPLKPEAPSKEAQLQLFDAPNQDAPGAPENSPQLLNTQPLSIATPTPSPIHEDVLSRQETQLDRPIRPAVVSSSSSPGYEDSGAQATAVAQMLGEELLDESEELMDLDEDEDIEDLDDEDTYEQFSVTRSVPSQTLVQVLPLSEATLPKTCYLVIDRASELITRPLRDFGDLGQIPTQEVQQRTLPVFDNHRVARRFSTKRDRVIKVPDSRMLQKTRSHLQAKGITRLLVDGQVYSLSK